jgi:pSer/pThr/pTyr-binding forkhead associated (FHA) protein
MRVVIDHIAGSRRGQRQEFSASSRIRFGRHPDCEVSFDPHRDIDASSRHAELRVIDTPHASATEPGGAHSWVLVDLGSSNGTYVEGHRITETPVSKDVPVSIEFGPGGPRIRLFVGDDASIESLPPPPVERTQKRWVLPVVVSALVLILVSLLLMTC